MSQHFQGPSRPLVLTFCGPSPNFECSRLLQPLINLHCVTLKLTRWGLNFAFGRFKFLQLYFLVSFAAFEKFENNNKVNHLLYVCGNKTKEPQIFLFFNNFKVFFFLPNISYIMNIKCVYPLLFHFPPPRKENSLKLVSILLHRNKEYFNILLKTKKWHLSEKPSPWYQLCFGLVSPLSFNKWGIL